MVVHFSDKNTKNKYSNLACYVENLTHFALYKKNCQEAGNFHASTSMTIINIGPEQERNHIFIKNRLYLYLKDCKVC